MNQFPNDWLTVYADHRLIFNYPKFVEAIGAHIDYIGFIDLYPEPTRLYLQMRYKEPPPSMERDLYLQRFPPLDVQIWGQPRRVQENGSIGEIIGELKLLGTITVFFSTARELKIETVFDQFAPRGVQEVIITLGKKINACIDDANAHPKATPVKVNEANHERVSSPTILDETVSALPTRQAGRTQDPINAWAIAQIQAKRDRSEVEKEYWQKRRERGDNVDAIPDMRDVWKKNVLKKITEQKRKN
jgi:hypothetical protein